MSQRRTSRDQPHLPIPIYARYRRCDPQRLVHIEAPTTYLTHLSLGTYLHTFLSFSTTIISSIPSIAIYTIHSLTQTQTQTLQAKIPYLTYPEFLSYQSIQSVNWSLAVQTRDPRLTSGIREGGGCKQRGRITLLPIMGNFSKKKKLVLLNA